MPKAVKRTAPRPFIDAARAAQILGCDPRTVRKMVSDGRLEGAQVPSANNQHYEWRIFTDQPLIEGPQKKDTARVIAGSGLSSAPLAALVQEIAELRAEIAELRSTQFDQNIRTVQDQNIQLVAAVRAMTDVLDEFQQATEHSQQSAEHSQQSAALFQSGSARLANVVSALLETVAAANTPDSPEGLDRV